jgi:hypothetical protein
MDNETVTLKLPQAMVIALRLAASDADLTPGHIIREAITRDLIRRQKAKTPVRADEALVAPLRALLADDFAYSQNWADLLQRLSAKGYTLAESGGGLVLQDCKTGTRLCKGSELGYAYAHLMRRFDAPFPGHSHQWAYHRVQIEKHDHAGMQETHPEA